MKSKTGKFSKSTEEASEFAKQLRANQTKAESKLWKFLRNRKLANAKFRRQHPIGPFIADFYCHKFKLVIEVDGNIHNNPDAKEYDLGRQFEIEELGIKVIRFSNEEVLTRPEVVIRKIKYFLIEE